MFFKTLLPQEEGPCGLRDKSQDAIFKTGMGKLWVILNQINGWTTGRCFPPASTAKFLFRFPGLSCDKQSSLSTGWGSHCSHENAHQETSYGLASVQAVWVQVGKAAQSGTGFPFSSAIPEHS